MKSSDPVFYSEAKEQDGLQFAAGWYWYDETWSWPSGPYATEAEARSAVALYALNVLDV